LLSKTRKVEADVDLIYEVPAELAKQLTGLRHDQDTPGLTVFEVLEPADKKAKMGGSFLRRLLGRGYNL
jgi:hypothetical protein